MSGVGEELYGDVIVSDGEAPAAPAPEPVSPAPASQVAESVVTPPPASVEPRAVDSVPLHVLLRTREEFGGKLTAAEQRARELEARLQEFERQREEEQAQVPDMLIDPNGYHRWSMQQARELARIEAEEIAEARIQAALVQDRLFRSKNAWEEKLGPEEWAKFNDWVAKAPPQFQQSARGQYDPYGFAHKEYARQQKLAKATELEQRLGGKSLDEVIEERVAAKLAEMQAAAQQSDRPRNERGRFAPSSAQEQQRHRPKSLHEMNGAAVIADQTLGPVLDGLYGD